MANTDKTQAKSYISILKAVNKGIRAKGWLAGCYWPYPQKALTHYASS